MARVKQFNLPDPGEGLVEAEIVTWKVKVGDTVKINDIIVEIETAKSLVELPVPYAGTVTELLVPEGETVAVGTPIIAVDTGVDDGTAAGTGDAGRCGRRRGRGDRGRQDRRRRPRRPRGRPGRLRPADDRGQAPSPQGRRPTASGRAAPPAGPAGARARRAGTGSRRRCPPLDAAPGTPPGRRPGAGQAAGAQVRQGPRRRPGRRGRVGRGRHHQPVRRRPAPAGRGRRGAGRHGRRRGGSGTRPAARTGERETRVPVKGVRKMTAQAMVASAFTAPHVTEFITVDVTRTMKLVERLRTDREFRDVKVSPLLLVAKALLHRGRAATPASTPPGTRRPQEIVVKNYVNLGIAAATPRGLMVPNIKDADAMSLRQLADAMAGARRHGPGGSDAAGRHGRRHDHHHQRRGVRGRQRHADPQRR